jgi:hypothetical protein
MKHAKSILVLLVLLALLGASQPAFVHADELPVASNTGVASILDTNAGTTVIAPDYVLTYPFGVYIPVNSYVYSDQYTMTAGKYVQGYLANSGGHNVYMTVVDAANTSQLLGSEVTFDTEDTTKTLWTNTTGTTKYVKIRFGASWPWGTVHATGNLIFGWF